MADPGNPRIVIDARMAMGGVERYISGLARLVQDGQGRNRILLYGRQTAGRFQPVSPRRSVRPGVRRALGGVRRILTDQLLLPLAASRFRAELIHSPNYLVPLCSRKPVVVTCHDLSLIDHFSTKEKGLMRHYERAVMLNGLRRAAHVIVPTRAVGAALRRRFRLPADRVSVLSPPLPTFCLDSGPEDASAAPYGAQRPFFLSVGTIEPRKNLPLLLQGWRRAYAVCRVPLLLVGPYGWGEKVLTEGRPAGSDGLRWLGCIDDAALETLYRQATAVVQYSLDEGFDYPAVEALCAGTPVVLSDIDVHREVTAGCGLFAPPDDPGALADQLLKVCSWSVEQRADFTQRSRQQAELFRQSATIEPYLALYERVLAGG